MRICGCLCFLGTAYFLVRMSAWLLDLPPNFLEAGNWGAREIATFAIALVGSIVGGLMGAGVGLQVSVRSAALNRLLLVLWHYQANGTIVAMLLLSLALAPTQRKLNVSESIQVWGWTAAACAAMAVLLFAVGQFKAQRRPNALVCVGISLPVSITLYRIYGEMFSLSPQTSTVLGVAYAVVVFLASAAFIRRDYEQAAQVDRMLQR